MANQHLRLENKYAIVTGSGQGIGQVIAQRLASEGATVALVGRTLSNLQETKKLIEDAGGKAIIATADISNPEDCQRLVQSLSKDFSSFDVLVNNAAIFDEPPFLETEYEHLLNTFHTNFFGTYLLSQAVAKIMVSQGRGSIVHISSVDAFGADGPVPVYSATKAAVSSLARSMTMELAPHGVRVNTVAPGFVNSDMLRKTSTENVLNHMLNEFDRVPLRRIVEPEEVAAAVAFLASDDASAVSGIDLVVDGGLISNLYVYETLPDPFEL